MRLTVLGCAGSFPSTDSACSAYHLEAEGFGLLLDFGTGSLSALQRYLDLRAVDAIILSHLHSDHVLDACSYVVVRRYAPDGPYPKLPLYGPSGARERLTGAYGSPDEGPLDDVYEFHTMRSGFLEIGPFLVTADRVEHPVETYGVRVEHQGSVLAYSADTAPCDAILRLAAGADAFLCEASYLASDNNPPGLHMTGRDAGEAAAKSGAERLLLTHLVPAWGDEQATLDEARSTFDGPIEVVRPGTSYDI
jgi:ribonuclease BN (tRNA processing enzyme)